MIDVGQGDAILIVTPDHKTMLIDGGPDQSLAYQLGVSLPWWQKQLDVVLLTHSHNDHLIGLLELNQRYQIGLILHNLPEEKSFLASQWLDGLQVAGIRTQKISNQESFSLGNYCRVNILSALATIDINDQSVVNELVCGQRRFLFTGDAGVAVEEKITESMPHPYDLIKISHHGSNSASSENFLAITNPRIAIISVGKNNRFSHPHPETLKRLTEQNVDIYRTDQSGSINIFANNNEIYLK